MNRIRAKIVRMPRFLIILLSIILFLLVPALFAADPRPNLIFILTDDQRADMMGNVTPRLQTPEMDRIVDQGVRFERAYVTTPICMASRASILSGTWERTNRYTGGAPRINDRFMLSAYPTLLREAGYQVGYVGKWHVAVNRAWLAPGEHGVCSILGAARAA